MLKLFLLEGLLIGVCSQTDNSPTKADHSSLNMKNYSKKSALRLRRSNAHSARTALCGAVLALSGTGAMVSVIPRPVPWHQRLDNRRSPLGASQQQKTFFFKKKKPSLASTISRFAESQYHRTMRSDAEPKKNFAESQYHSTKKSDPKKNGVRKQDTVQSVHRQLSPYVNPLDIMIETQQCRLRQDRMCTRSTGPHHHVQSREYHHKTCGSEHGRPTNITLLQLKRDA